ncbi:MAG TPA: hypothetical protein PKC72_16780 [Chitinophagaceae bacterium]|nr:hypothetical protein [Chitinophagaceae bacterium]
MSVFKHHSAVAVANCMLLLKRHMSPNAGVMGATPIHNSNVIAQIDRAQPLCAGSNPVSV